MARLGVFTPLSYAPGHLSGGLRSRPGYPRLRGVLPGLEGRRTGSTTVVVVLVLVVVLLVVDVLVLVLIEVVVLRFVLVVFLVVVVEHVLQVFGLQRHGHGEPLVERGNLRAHLRERCDEVLREVGGRLGVAMRADDFFSPFDEVLSVQLEARLALLAGEVDAHGRARHTKHSNQLSTSETGGHW
ncbi:hypothetical protein MXAN_3516 [Myxococcus xanthus DK 1622]|uniref:Uncharacterized protein n=1 Tax=Myxococcus xanthus (strain DK1622) TaxID=246197 RepID=Q1D6L3_MYXXD|nr:hypothetical protein MXAN_3516 [Myxococcus xanthus DK 1622]